MEIAFYGVGAVAVIATALAITGSNAIHALLNIILSLLSVALIFFMIGAPFMAALEVIVYAGAIMVLFVFVVMMLDLRNTDDLSRASWAKPRSLLAPAVLAALLLAELIYVLASVEASAAQTAASSATAVPVVEVSRTLFGPYLIGVELASILLLAGLVGAYHLGEQYGQQRRRGRGEREEGRTRW